MDLGFLERTFSLAGRTVLVTGGASGLGMAIGRAMGAAGARIAVNARSSESCAMAVESFRKAGITAISAPCDVSDDEAVACMRAMLVDAGYDIDVLVTSAGIQNRKSVTDMSLVEWRALMDVHVSGAFNCAHAFLPSMVARGFGRLVLVSSVAGQAAMPNVAAYASAKGAISAFTRALAVEYGGRGITANAIAPGFTRTGLTQALQDNADFQRFLSGAVPAGRWAEPEEVAPAVVFLASAAGSFINGHVLTIDGGMLARM